MDKCDLFQNIRSLLKQLLEQIDKYTLSFSQKDFFTFSDIEERSKLYKHEYYTFICEFNAIYASLGQRISEIATLMLEADRSMDEEKTVLFNSIFQKHLLLEKELSVFTSATEKELAKASASVSLLLDSANRLSISIKALSDTLPCT